MVSMTGEEILGELTLSSSLYTKRNPLCFVDRLPTETLEAIFIRCAHRYHRRAGGNPLATAPSWVNVSYVSHYWRNVALNCASLWTYLFITSPRWTEELLARSKQAPLKIYMSLQPEDEERGMYFLEQVVKHLERIQELRIQGGYRLLSKLSTRAPCLRNLEICVDDHYPSDWSWEPFGADTPALRTLKLLHCPMPWYSLKLSGLTKLTLVYNRNPEQKMEEFLVTLRCMQDLTHLRLDGVLASAAGFLSSPAFHTFQKISLPRLSRLFIFSQPATVAALLSCVDIPLKAELNLNTAVKDRSSTPDHYTMLSSLLAQRFSRSEDQLPYGQSIRSLVIGFSQRGDADVTFGTSEFNCNVVSFSRFNSRNPNFPIQITHPIRHVTDYSNWERIISHTCCPVSLSNVRRVSVSQPPCSPAFWTHVLGNLPGLRYLKLTHSRMPSIPSLLSLAPPDCAENQDEQSERGGSQVYVPELEELVLESMEFSTLLEKDQNVPDTLKASTVQALYDALSTRKDTRIRLVMIKCKERDSDKQERKLDVAGWWEGGHFYVDSERDSNAA